ncbi:MAG: redoxin domain-containing protein [Actinomycetota bacterium]|nr:redoxin domain-containing protein [Actinomycetota bacterium]
MSKPSTRQRPPRLTGAARRRAQAKRQKRNRLLLRTGVVMVVALVALVIALHAASSSGSSSANGSTTSTSGVSLPVGTTAPNGVITTLSGTTETVAALRGKPALIWFMTTWCSSCQAGTQAMAQNIATLAADGVRVVQVENYADLGQSGPAMGTFARTLAGSAFTNPDWTFGEASSSLTHTYNPKAYLDLYYLINAEGKITYVNSAPASTMPQLLSAAKALA